MDLRSYWRLLGRRWLVLLCTFLAAWAALAGAGFLMPTVYTADVKIVVSPNLPADATMETRHTAELYLAARMKTYSEVVTTDSVLQPVIDNLRLGVSVPELAEALEVTVPADSSVIDVAVSAPTAAEAASTANQIASQMQVAVANLEGSASVLQVSVLQPATPPSERSFPNVPLNLAVAFVLAVLAAIFAAVIVDTFDTRVRRGRDITGLGVPYLGGIPKARGAKGGDLLTFTEQTPQLQAIFKRIAVDVLYAVGERPAYLIFTSPRLGAGKTMVAANIAGALAEVGYRVAFIDADVRGGRLAARVGLNQTPGVAELVSGRIELGEYFVPETWGGFTVIPSSAGAIDIGPMLAGDKFADVMRGFAKHFDVVIVDTPPITNPSEASRFTRNISNVVVAAEAVSTRRADLARVIDPLRQAGARVLGAVLFEVRKAEPSAPADNEDHHDAERSDHVGQRPRHGRDV